MTTPPRFLGLIAAIAGSGILGACGHDTPASSGKAATKNNPKSAAGDRPPVAVSLRSVRIGAVWRTVEVTGTLFGEEEAVIASKLSGRIESISADVGDRTPSGTVLARIESRDHQLALDAAQAALTSSLARLGLSELPAADFDPETLPTVRRSRAEAANALAKHDRARRLFEQTPPLISEQDFADIRTANDVAQQTVQTELLAARALLAEARAQETAAAMARQRLADTTVSAPASSTAGSTPLAYQVAARLVSTGEYVNPGQAMFRLVASDRIDFRAEVVERYAGQVVPGQSARIWVEAYPEPFSGRVSRVSPRIDPASRSFPIEIRIDNKDGRLKPGAFARGEIRLREDPDVTLVPADALANFAGVTRVFSIDAGKAKEHRVRAGIRVGNEVEIVGGLPVRELIVPQTGSLADGTPIQISPK
ncbi:MAG: efflux RND transporter periplasmic adaptor subunit [Phycisphaerales bacterium]|nr:efflux RND transporter periplasmic adaptor subunit [Phycisphaerales bacterium]